MHSSTLNFRITSSFPSKSEMGWMGRSCIIVHIGAWLVFTLRAILGYLDPWELRMGAWTHWGIWRRHWEERQGSGMAFLDLRLQGHLQAVRTESESRMDLCSVHRVKGKLHIQEHDARMCTSSSHQGPEHRTRGNSMLFLSLTARQTSDLATAFNFQYCTAGTFFCIVMKD